MLEEADYDEDGIEQMVTEFREELLASFAETAEKSDKPGAAGFRVL